MPRPAALRIPLPPSASLSSGGISAASSTSSWSRNGVRASSPWAIVMLSTRLTGSSTSMIRVSSRSARSTGVAAPGALEPLGGERARDVLAGGRGGQLAQLRVVAVEELRRVGVEPAARRLEHRRVPAVAAEHLVGALAGLHDLALARDRLREQPERDAVVRDHRLAHRGDRLRERLHELVRADADLVVVGRELGRDRSEKRELVALAAARVGEADRERRQPALALLGQQRHDQARVQPAGEQHADRHVGDHPPPHGHAQRVQQRVAPLASAALPVAARADGFQYSRCAARAVGLDRPASWPAGACARRRGSCAARARRSASSGSGAARPGRRSCRRRPRPAAPAASRRRAGRRPAARRGRAA